MPTRFTMASGPRLLRGNMSRSMVLLSPESVLISMAHIATKGHTVAQYLEHHSATLVSYGYTATGAIQT